MSVRKKLMVICTLTITFYHLEIAPDGAFIKLTPTDQVKLGKIKLPDNLTEFAASGENGSFTRYTTNKPLTLPVGKYHLDGWIKALPDDRGRIWRILADDSDQSGIFTIVADHETDLNAGDHVNAVLTVQKVNNSTYSFNQLLKGSMGENLTLLVDGDQPPPPKLHIKNPDGSYNRTFSFEYG